MLKTLKVKAEIFATKVLRLVPYLQIIFILSIICNPSQNNAFCPSGYSNACVIVSRKNQVSFVAINEDDLLRANHGLTAIEVATCSSISASDNI